MKSNGIWILVVIATSIISFNIGKKQNITTTPTKQVMETQASDNSNAIVDNTQRSKSAVENTQYKQLQDSASEYKTMITVLEQEANSLNESLTNTLTPNTAAPLTKEVSN